MLQCVAMCSVSQGDRNVLSSSGGGHGAIFKVKCCNMLQCVAVCCSVWQLTVH